MSKQKSYRQLYQEMKKQQEQLHLRNQKRIRTGIRCIIFVPMFFLLLMLLTDSNKVVFLTMWIISLFTIAAYLIYVEYVDFCVQQMVAKLSRMELEAEENLLEDGLAEIEENAPEILRKIEEKLPERRKIIRQIIRRDINKISTNVVAVVIIMGLIVLPSLYAWFNILSNWNPYEEEATSQLKIAVISNDAGFEKNHIKLCVGDTILEALSENTTMGWTFPGDERRAINGVYDGEYYAAMVIPENFTETLFGVLDGDLSGGTIAYYENEKKNAIAAKITSKAQTAVQNQVNRSVFAAVSEVVLKLGTSLKQMQSDHSFEQVLSEKIDAVDESISEYLVTLGGIHEMGDAVSKTLAAVNKLSGKLLQDLQDDFSLVPDSAVRFTGLQTACIRLSDYEDSLTDADVHVKETEKLLKDLQTMLRETKKGIGEIAGNAGFQELLSSLTENPGLLSKYLSSLMEVDSVPVYETPDYGSSMAPFYSVLAIWVGALILVAVIHLKIHPVNGVGKLKVYQEFFGRYTLFFLIGQAQTLLCVLGDLFFIRIQCHHPFLFWFAAAVSSFVFTIMIYSLTFVFGNVGEAIAVIMMVIQVAGTGGTFPKEVLPAIYQRVFDFMPFPYCMTALRECVSGMYKSDYWIALGKLILFAVIFLAMALLLKKPFSGLNARIDKSKEKSGIMI